VGPAALLEHADNRLFALGLSSRGAFVTAFSGSLDTAAGTFTYSCAGHPHPRLVRTTARTVAPLSGTASLPLGALDERPARREDSIVLDPGDIIVLYSNGVTEARSPHGELFGVERLDQVLRDLPRTASPDDAVQAIQQAVEAFGDHAAPADDQTLLAVRWQPDPVAARSRTHIHDSRRAPIAKRSTP
jgi:serine phosphatase RsbU (regulator of sigma subunit)